MAFTSGFGGYFGEQLGQSLANLIDEYSQVQQKKKQSNLLSQLLAPQGQQSPQLLGQKVEQPIQAQRSGQPSLLPASLGQVLAQAQKAGLSPQQLQLIEHEYKRREDAARQQQKQSREDIRQLQKESRADYKEILQEEGQYDKDIKGAYKNVPKIKKVLQRIISNANAASPYNTYIPQQHLSAQSRNLDTDIKKVVNLLSDNFQGRLTNAKLGFIAGEKPDITMSPESVKYSATNILEDINEFEQEFNIAREIKKRNNDRIPRNYQDLVAQELGLRKGPVEEKEFREQGQPKNNITTSDTDTSNVRSNALAPTGINQSLNINEPSQVESPINTLSRLATGTATSALGGAAEVPSSLAGLGSALYQLGNPARQIEDPERRAQAEKRVRETEGPDIFERAQNILPTAESIKEHAKDFLPEGYLEPRNDSERFLYDVGEDMGTLLFPLGKTSGVLKAGGISLGGNIGKYLTKYAGGSEKAQNRAKLGSMLATSFALQPFIKSKINAYYDSLSNSPKIDSPIITKNINNVINNIEKTHSRIGDTTVPSKEFINETIDSYHKTVSPGNQSIVRDLWAFKKDLGEKWAKAPSKAKPFLLKIQDAVNNALKKNEEVPKFIKNTLTEVDQLNTGLHNSQKAFKFINKNLGKFTAKGTKYGIVPFVQQLVTSPQKTLVTTGIGAAGAGITSGAGLLGGILKELATNSAFRNAYKEFATASLKENKTELIKYFNKMNKAVKNKSN